MGKIDVALQKTDYKTGPSEGACPVDLLHCATLSSVEAQGEVHWAAGQKTHMNMRTLHVPNEIHQSAGEVKLGVTKTVLVPCSLVTVPVAAEMSREISQSEGLNKGACIADVLSTGG